MDPVVLGRLLRLGLTESKGSVGGFCLEKGLLERLDGKRTAEGKRTTGPLKSRD